MIEALDIVKTFGSFRALDGITLTVPEGQWGLLYGPNGAGKTTLIKILATLMQPTEGSLRILGHDPAKEPEAVRRQLGLISHQTHLYEDLTAWENLAFTAALYGVNHRAERIERAIKEVELLEWKDAPVRVLSNGMKKRIALARSMLIEPRLLLLDEPYAGLDARSQHLLTSYLVFFKEGGGTILLSTHHPEALADSAVDKLFIMRRGRVERDEVVTGRQDWAESLGSRAAGGVSK
jgi:heme ABC exporter ATP-binding subunit CcmA